MSENTENVGKVPAALTLHTGGKIAPVIPTTIEECYRLAKLVTMSEMAPKEYRGKAEEACVTIMHGLELGIPPMAALQNISNINGRPCVWGDLALALVRASGLLEEITEEIRGEGDAKVAVCTVKRKGEKPFPRKFSVADAKNAKLWNKRGSGGQDTPWVTYPERMMQMRARAFALRDGFADVLKGLSIREEVEDYSNMKDVTPVPPAPPSPESGPTMDAVQGSSPRAAEDQGGSRPTPVEGAEGCPQSTASPDPAASASLSKLADAVASEPTPVDAEAIRKEVDLTIPEELLVKNRVKESGFTIDKQAEVVAAEAAAQQAEEGAVIPMSREQLAKYLDDLEARYEQAPDRSVVEEIRQEHVETGRPRMLPFDERRADEAYGKAVDRTMDRPD